MDMRYSAAMADATPRILGEERRARILDVLGSEGKVLASDLARRLDVSLDTVRRDLQELAAAGALRRVHGGALPPTPGAVRFVDRREEDVEAKGRIASAAAALVRPGEVIALGGGTTMVELARRLPESLRATVVSLGPDAALALVDRPGLAVDVVGGRLHPHARIATGAEAVRALAAVRPDTCLISTCSVHPAVGLSFRHREEAEVVGAMLEGAGRVIGLATAAKLGSAAPFPAVPLERLDILVTDAPEGELAVYRERGIDVVRA